MFSVIYVCLDYILCSVSDMTLVFSTLVLWFSNSAVQDFCLTLGHN
jgi:hypothetical protein